MGAFIPIDKTKILLIVNSSDPVSAQVADYYCAARGISVDHRLSFAFGSVHVWAYDSDVITEIADYIIANRIKAVFCSAATPTGVSNIPGISQNYQTLAWMCGASSGYIYPNLISGDPSYATKQTALTDPTKPYWYQVTSTLELVLNLTDIRGVIPHGRIGIPRIPIDYQYIPNPTYYTPAETYSASKALIDTAIASEYSISEVIGAGKKILFGMHDRTAPIIDAAQSEVSRQLALAVGLSVDHYTRSAATTWLGTPISPSPIAQTVNYNTFVAGGYSGAKKSIWGMIGNALTNLNLNAAWLGSCTFLSGCWGYEVTSFGLVTLAPLLTNGGCAIAGTYFEPLSPNLAFQDEFLRQLLYGKTFCEAALQGNVSGYQTVWGDPLYAPFGKEALYVSLEVTEMTMAKVMSTLADAVNRNMDNAILDTLTSKTFGGLSDGVTDDTASINKGIASIASTYTNGVLIIPAHTVYVEANLVMDSGVVLLDYSQRGKLRIFGKNEGTSVPGTKSGLEIKSQGNTGILLRDDGKLQVLDATTGALAGIEISLASVTGYIDFTETTTPAAPPINTARLFAKDNGSNKTQLCAIFNTGAVQQISIQP